MDFLHQVQEITGVPHQMLAGVFTSFGILLGIPAVIVADIELGVRVAAAAGAFGASIMGGIYYYYAIKEKRMNLKNQKSNPS